MPNGPTRFSLAGGTFAVAMAGLVLVSCGPAGGDAPNGSAAAGEAPEFYADVLPVLEENCQACHGTTGLQAGGMSAPMALETYEEARAWAPMIARAVSDRRMPPWSADERHRGTFVGERYLTQDERDLLVAWAEGGAPAGDPVSVTASRTGSEAGPREWWLGQPDLVIEFAEPLHVSDEVDDWQPTIVVPVPEEDHSEARWIQASELRPGGPYVHHIVSSHLGVGTPGRGAFAYPEGWGLLLPSDPVVTFNMHYYKRPGPGTAVDDVTRGAFRFHEPGQVVDYVVETDINMTRDFLIPAGASNHEVSWERPFDEDTYLLSMGPHAHYRGKSFQYELEYPDGEREVLLWIPDYDFNWQHLYQFEEPRFIPAGSVLHATWRYDNSADNPYNPDPSADVSYGIETFHEMANARIYYASAEPRGIVVGEPIPDDVLRAAEAQEERRRQQFVGAEGAGADH